MKLLPVEQSVDGGITIRGWRTESRGRALLVFLHGNGFCGRVYLPMHRELAEDFDLLLLDVPGHGQSDLIDCSWNQTAELVYQALKQELETLKPVSTFGVGHSLGGVLTLLSAHRHPGTFSSLVLLDPVFFPPRMLLMMRAVRALRLTTLVHPMVRPALRRRYQWDTAVAAREYFHGRKIFYGWTDEALQAYVDYALRRSDCGGVELCCHPTTEARFFATLPSGLWRALRDVPCATTLVMGQDSYPFALEAAASAAAKSANISFKLVAGGHCHMQQNPLAAALCIKAAFD